MDSDSLPLARPGIDRDAARRANPELIGQLREDPATRVVHVAGGRVAAVGGTADHGPHLLLDGPRLVEADWIYLGTDHAAAYVAQISDRAPEEGHELLTLRETGWLLSGAEAGLATTALALANWHTTHGYCPRCGQPTAVEESGWVRRCLGDGSAHFPRTDPAVIMAITDPQERLLLGHSAHWPSGQYSVPAGFVEPGESLEGAVCREVLEETSVRVTEVSYAASQPWPFPASLMVGFRGRTEDETAVPDGVEVTDARFVTRAQLAQEWRTGQTRMPRRTSIAYSLIHDWFGQPIPSR